MSDITKEYYANGNLEYIKYFNANGELHREGGPAQIFYCDDGNLKMELYFSNGKWHRGYAPAYINYCGILSGDVVYGWAFNGKVYSREVIKWIMENGFNSWEDMTKDDFNRMWMEILD